jgi:hypothetical protein
MWPEALVDAAKIAVREIQSAQAYLRLSSFFEYAFAKRSKAAKGHSNRQVAALYLASGDVTRIRPTAPYPYYRFYHPSRRVSASRIMLAVVAV